MEKILDRAYKIFYIGHRMSAKKKYYKLNVDRFWPIFKKRFRDQNELAMLAGIHFSYLSQLLNGRHPFTEEKAKALAKAMRVGFDKLFTEVE